MGIREDRRFEGARDSLRCRVLYPSVRDHRERKML